jgi:hypothetical protein
VQWKDFTYGGQVYDLRHLAPFTLRFDRAAEQGKAAIVYTVDVVFSLHCFTSKFPDKPFDPKLKYADARETRVFDFERYELSKRLPEIVRTLDHRRCLHTGHGNFVTIQIVTNSGETRSYHVFFEPSKSGKKGRLNLYIQSGYVPARKVGHTGKPMRFLFILHNTLNNIPIRA